MLYSRGGVAEGHEGPVVVPVVVDPVVVELAVVVIEVRVRNVEVAIRIAPAANEYA